jgi:hypothetical protein
MKRRTEVKRNIFLILIVVICIAAIPAPAQFHKYDIKSGIATLDIVSTVANTQIKMTKIVYFDDYGLKECEETFSGGKLSGVFLCDGKDKYSLSLKSKKAKNQGPTSRGIGTRIEINDMGTKEDIASGKVKKISPMTLAGQTCEMIQVNSKGGAPTIYGGWHQVLVYMKSGGTVSTLIKAVKLEPNAAVPKEKFEIPAGYTKE